MTDFHKPRIPLAIVPTPLGAWDVGHIARTIEREITQATRREREAAASTNPGSLATEQYYAGRVHALLGVLAHLREATASPMPPMFGEDAIDKAREQGYREGLDDAAAETGR